MGFVKEFKEFAMRGNVLDMAVGIVIGGAFGKIVSSFVNDILMPPLGLLIGGINFTDLKLTLRSASMGVDGVEIPAVTFNYGNFQVIVDFLIIAFAIFILLKGINQFKKKKEEAPAAPAEPPADIQLLTEIRDLLKKQQ